MRKLDGKSATHLKALIFGDTGTGKTTLGVTCPTPLIILSETQGEASIRAAAKEAGMPMPATALVETIEDVRAIHQSLLVAEAGKPFELKTKQGDVIIKMKVTPESVVLDSVTDIINNLLFNECLRELPKDDHGLPKDGRKNYGMIAMRGRRLITAFRDLPMHVLFLALAREDNIGTDDEPHMIRVPDITGKCQGATMAAVNLIGLSYRKVKGISKETGNREMQYGITTTGPASLKVKTYRPLLDDETPDFADWVKRINETDTPEESEKFDA